MLKLVSYATFCPRTPENIGDIIVKVRSVESEYALLASLVFIEILSDYYVLHSDYELALRVYRKFRTSIFNMRFAPKLQCILSQIYNLMIGEKVFHVNSKKCLDVAQKIFEIIFNKNFSSPSVWPLIIEELAKLFSEVFHYEVEDVEEILMTADLSLPFFMASLTYSVSYSSFLKRIMRYYQKQGSPVTILSRVLPIPDKELLRLWYRERAKELVRVRIQTKVFYRKTKERYPVTWSLGDPIEELDIFLSMNISPLIIPGYTTKKWASTESIPIRSSIVVPNVLLIIDSSMSMGRLPGDLFSDVVPYTSSGKITYVFGSKFDIAVLVAFAVIDLIISLGGRVAAINFSGKAIVTGFTDNKVAVEDVVLVHQNDGTVFPVKAVERITRGSKGLLIIIISDAAIYNRDEVLRCLEDLSKNNDVYFIHVDVQKADLEQFFTNISKSVRIIRISSISDLPRTVLNLVSKHMIEISSLEV